MNFLQFFIWACWLITIGAYWFQNKGWSGAEFGAIFSTMGIASLFMPTLAGIIADKYINAERLYAILHFLGALVLVYIPQVDNPNDFFWAILLCVIFYMPTLALSNSIAYTILKNNNTTDLVKDFPPIRVWGTVGFVVALWVISLTHNETSANQFYIAAASAIVLAIYSLTLPKCPPLAGSPDKRSFVEILGLNAFKLFKDPKNCDFLHFCDVFGSFIAINKCLWRYIFA